MDDPRQWLQFGGQDMDRAPAGLPMGQAVGTDAAYHAAEGLVDAAKLARQVQSGEVNPMSDEGIERALNAAMIAQMGGFAGAPARAGEAVLGSGPVLKIMDPAERAANLARFMEKAKTPPVLYHASHADIPEFKRTKGSHLGFHFGDVEAANNRLEDTAERFPWPKADRDERHAIAEEHFNKLKAYEEAMRRKNAEVPMDELVRALDAGEDVGPIFKKYEYAPTPEEQAQLDALREAYQSSRPPIIPPGGVGANIGAYHVAINNPLRMPDVGNWGSVREIKKNLPFDTDARSQADLLSELKGRGYDGIVYQNRVENPVMRTDSFIAFDPEQAKSAIGNAGTFDPTKARVNEARGGEVDAALHAVRHHLAGGGFLSDLFSGPDYLSTGEAASPTNWGDPESAADFFKADRALRLAREVQAADDVTGSTPAPRRQQVAAPAPAPAPEPSPLFIPYREPEQAMQMPDLPEPPAPTPLSNFQTIPGALTPLSSDFVRVEPPAPEAFVNRAVSLAQETERPPVEPLAYAAAPTPAPAAQAITEAMPATGKMTARIPEEPHGTALTKQQADYVIRTIAAETSGKSPEETQAIASVILNRINSGKYGATPEAVLFAKRHFEPWMNKAGKNYPMKISPTSQRYSDARDALEAAMAGEDITRGATNFWGPKSQYSLGRDTPDWAVKMPDYTDIGATRFHRPNKRAEGGEVDGDDAMRDDFDKGGVIKKAMRAIQNYQDPATRKIADWNWRPLADVDAELGLTEIPPHVQAFGDYMRGMSDKAAGPGLTARDLIKGYTTTRASIQRRATDADRLRQLGLDLPDDVKMIRPEGAWAEWLGTPMGKRYLDAAARGDVEGDAVANAIKVMSPFGRHETDIPDSMKWAAQNLPGREATASDLVARAAQGASAPEEWRQFTSDIRGVGPSKSGFLASLYGRGDQPTLDARQLILNTGEPTKLAAPFLARSKGEGGVEAVDRLAARQSALGLQVPSQYDPFYQHLAHHSIWDKASNEMTTHGDVVKAMQDYAHGGLVDDALHVVREHHADGEAVGPTMQQRLRETIASIDPERSREQPVMDPATMGEAWNRARQNYQNFPAQEGEAVARPLELGARDVVGGAIGGEPRAPGAQFRRGVADLLVGSTGLPDSGTLGFGVADAPMVTGIPLTLADMAHDISQGDYANAAMNAALPAAFYARGPLGAAGRRAVEIAKDYAKPAAAGAAGVVANVVTPEDAEAAKLSKLIRAYHGSPHKFDRFDLSKIGTGEGAQAYGHGLYFAESEPVAQSYRDILSSAKAINDLPGYSQGAAQLIRNKGEIGEQMFRQHYADLGPEKVEQAIAEAKAAISKAPTGHMYEVGIHASPEQLLNWDKPLREQSGHVREVLSSTYPEMDFRQWKDYGSMKPYATAVDEAVKGTPLAGFSGEGWLSGKYDVSAGRKMLARQHPEKLEAFDNAISAFNSAVDPTGKDILHGLAKSWESEGGLTSAPNTVFASEKLHEAGIPGIKYLDAGSRGITGIPTHNYVIFNDKLIDINRRYAEGGEVEPASVEDRALMLVSQQA